MNRCFITFEGVEGCGKSTQIALLAEHLVARGFEVVTTREPGGPPIAEAVRQVLLDINNQAMAPITEVLLYEAARAQHVHEVIRPALERGAVVLCDRFADSTTAYQGAGRRLDMDEVHRLHRLATQGVWPDRTYVLDLDPATGLARARARGRADRLEQEELAFHQRVRRGFLELAQSEPERIRIVDGALSVEELARHIRTDADALLAG